MRQRAHWMAAVSLGFLLLLPAFAQERSHGVSLHMLPKRVAELSGAQWGLSVDSSAYLTTGTHRLTFQSAADLLVFFRQQSAAVQSNGIWVVTTNPDAYSGEEKALLEEVKSMCRRESIPLFICRASELPNGWARFDK